MNRISLTDLARNEPLEPFLEKEVQLRAYELYEQRGKGHGFALEDWLEAEAEVLVDFPIPFASAIRPCGNFCLTPCKKLFRASCRKICAFLSPCLANKRCEVAITPSATLANVSRWVRSGDSAARPFWADDFSTAY